MAVELIYPFAMDRGSKYAAASFPVSSEGEFEQGMKGLLKPKRFRDADHHIVAYRLLKSDGGVTEYKNDGYRSPSKETGAGVMVLEIMRQRGVVNRCVVVTRWYGGVHLGADRFRHVREAAKAVLDRI